MSTVAEKLRQARETQNLTVHQVADITKSGPITFVRWNRAILTSFPRRLHPRFCPHHATLLSWMCRKRWPPWTRSWDARRIQRTPPLMDQKRGSLDFVMLQLSKVSWRKGLIVWARQPES